MARLHQSSRILLVCIFIALYSTLETTGNPVKSAPNVRAEKDKEGYYVIGRSPGNAGHYEKAAVATSSKLCAESGAKMLRKGGSPVDAAIAALLCDGVVSLQGLGIGGGFLMTIWDAKEKKAYFLNAREHAPAAAYERIFNYTNKDEAHMGVKSIAVPGEIAGYWEAHQKFGKLPWRDLFEDVINICEDGSPVSKYVANDIKKVEEEVKDPKFSSLKSILVSEANPSKLKDFGESIQRHTLAETLRKIRDHGKDVFYQGEIAQNLVREIQEGGGIITLDDFKNYKPEWKVPVSTTVKGYKMYSAPTPGSGAVLFFMLNVLEGLIPAPSEEIMYQRIAETFKWGYARRNELGDYIDRPEYENKHSQDDCKVASELVKQYEEKGYAFVSQEDGKWDKDCLMSITFRKLLSKDYAEQVRGLIEDDKTYNDYAHYNLTAEGRVDLGTAHTSVYGEDGSAVSVTSTINTLMGSLVRSESTGIILNNEMDDYCYPGIRNSFDVEASEYNFVRNKSSTLRPMSSMSPTIILNEDETVRLIIGSAGGTKITTGVTLGIIQHLFLGKNIKDSLDAPRIHHNLWPMAVQVEPEVDSKIVEYLQLVGHEVTDWRIMQNTLSAIAVNGPSGIDASGDYRREGGSGGY